MKRLSRMMGFFLTLCLAVTATGCSPHSSSNESGDKPVVVAATAAPPTLDITQNAAAAIAQVLLYNVYETLTKIDDNGDLKPLLARSWQQSPDGLTYTFHLDPAARFASGAPVDAKAVAASLDNNRKNGIAVTKAQLGSIKTVRVKDSHTVVLNLSHPDNFLLFYLGCSAGVVIDPTVKTDLATHPAGSGPYVVTDFRPGHSVDLATSPNAWHLKPKVSHVQFLYFADPTPETAALMSGDVDILSDLATPQALSRFQDPSRYDVITGTTNYEVVMGMNNQSKALSDKRVRRAIMHAIDRKNLMKAVTNGQGSLIGSMVPPTDPWYEDLAGKLPYDPDQARRLLKEAGYGNGLSLRMRVPTLPYATTSARIIASELKQVGITLVTDELEFPARWLDAVYTRADYDLTIVGHFEPRDIVNWANPDYYWRYDNPKFQKLVTKAMTGPANEVNDTMKQAARILNDDVSGGFLYLMPKTTVTRAGITGLGHNATSLSFDLTGLEDKA